MKNGGNRMDKGSTGLPITPDTKVGALLEAYPGLEDVLAGMVPAFSRLRNPVLRKTVAKVATLRQVAQVGQLDLSAFINLLRREVGLEDSIHAGSGMPPSTERAPGWFDPALVSMRLDARDMIEAGEHPVRRVLESLRELEKGRIFELTTAFVPSPLIDIAKEKGYKVWSLIEGPALVKSYFVSK